MPDGFLINWAATHHEMVANHAGVPLNALLVEAKVGKAFSYPLPGEAHGSLHLSAELDYTEPIEVECPVVFLSLSSDQPGVEGSVPGGIHNLWLKLDGEWALARLNGLAWAIHSAKIAMDISLGTYFTILFTTTEYGVDHEWVALLQRLP